MVLNRIDTLIIGWRLNISSQWFILNRWDSIKSKNGLCYICRQQGFHISYILRFNWLIISFNVPRLVHGNNIYPTCIHDYNIIQKKLYSTLKKLFDTDILNKLPKKLKQWQVSRCDLFYDIPVELEQKLAYLNAYGKFTMPGYNRQIEKGTVYFNSGKNAHINSSNIICITIKISKFTIPKQQLKHAKL